MPAASQHREHGGLPRPEELDRNLPDHSLGCSNKRALIAAAQSHRDIHVLPVELVQPLRGVRGRSSLVDRELGFREPDDPARGSRRHRTGGGHDDPTRPKFARASNPHSAVGYPGTVRRTFHAAQRHPRHDHEHEGRLRTIDLENGFRPEDVTAAAKQLE